MRRSIFVGFVIVFTLAAMTLSAATGYVVILKNGHKIRAKEPLQIDGPNAIITLATGTMTSYPLDQVDLVATERYNKLGLGDAIMIEELTVAGETMPTPTPRKSLGQLATIDARGDAELGSTAAATPTPTPGIQLQAQQYGEGRVTAAFSEILDQSKLYLYRTSTGTRPDYFFVQAVTDDQREVFQTLRIIVDAFTLLVRRYPDLAPKAVELEMVGTSGKAAGTFRITPAMATELSDERLTVEQFYVKYVIF